MATAAKFWHLIISSICSAVSGTINSLAGNTLLEENSIIIIAIISLLSVIPLIIVALRKIENTPTQTSGNDYENSYSHKSWQEDDSYICGDGEIIRRFRTPGYSPYSSESAQSRQHEDSTPPGTCTSSHSPQSSVPHSAKPQNSKPYGRDYIPPFPKVSCERKPENLTNGDHPSELRSIGPNGRVFFFSGRLEYLD